KPLRRHCVGAGSAATFTLTLSPEGKGLTALRRRSRAEGEDALRRHSHERGEREGSCAMDTVKYELKLFVEHASRITLQHFTPIFHPWLTGHGLEELLIDVADYRHVPDGQGIVLIGHDAHYAMDLTDGRLGLLYSRRRETQPGLRDIHSVGDRLRSVWCCALTACQRLAAHPALAGRLQFRGNELLLRCNDRLHGPNTAAAYSELCQHLEPVLAPLYPGQEGGGEHYSGPPPRQTVSIRVEESPDVDTLLTRLGARAC